jgi:hypothetical protein
MYIGTIEDTREIMKRAHLERNAAVRAFFMSFFIRKPRDVAGIAAQAA